VVPLIAGGLLITAAVLVIRKMKKKQGGYQANEDWEEGYLHVPIPSR
jgi:hypothetical protein